jgi:aryl-alcohol dehydrogenase-like predicted oxidoreductase
LRVSEIGFGCGGTAGLMTADDFDLQSRAVARALELGITYFDTAAVYGRGRSEENLGRVLDALDAQPIVATKVALEWADLDDIPGSVRRSIEGSLARLRRDRLDVVHLHNRVGPARAAKATYGSGALLSVDDVIGAAGVFETLDSLRRAGRIGVIGCCAFGGDPRSVQRLLESGRFESVLINHSFLNPSAWRPVAVPDEKYDYAGVAARADARGMGIVSLRILEGGLLTGPIGEGGAAGRATEPYRTILERLARLDPQKDGIGDRAELAVRYVLSNASVSTALVGFSSVAQIDAAVQYAERGPLSAAQLQLIEGLRPSEKAWDA